MIANELLSIIDPSSISIVQLIAAINWSKSVQGFSLVAVQMIFLEIKLREMGV
jgi:hypothetical protein